MLHKAPTPQTNGQRLEEVRPRKKNPTKQLLQTVVLTLLCRAL